MAASPDGVDPLRRSAAGVAKSLPLPVMPDWSAIALAIFGGQQIGPTVVSLMPHASREGVDAATEWFFAHTALESVMVAGRIERDLRLTIRSRAAGRTAAQLAERLGRMGLVLDDRVDMAGHVSGWVRDIDRVVQFSGRLEDELIQAWRNAARLRRTPAHAIRPAEVTLTPNAPRSEAGRRPKSNKKAAIGWREWVGLPDFGVREIKAKVDSGARSSSLHAFRVRTFERDGRSRVQFAIHPRQRSKEGEVVVEQDVHSFRRIRSSNGHVSVRPVIVTNLIVAGQTVPIELTLANRDQMGFRMLIGREAFRGRFLLDVGRSYLGGHPPAGAPGERA